MRSFSYFGVSVNLWLGHQQDYELKLARKEDLPAIERQAAPVTL